MLVVTNAVLVIQARDVVLGTGSVGGQGRRRRRRSGSMLDPAQASLLPGLLGFGVEKLFCRPGLREERMRRLLADGPLLHRTGGLGGSRHRRLHPRKPGAGSTGEARGILCPGVSQPRRYWHWGWMAPWSSWAARRRPWPLLTKHQERAPACPL